MKLLTVSVNSFMVKRTHKQINFFDNCGKLVVREHSHKNVIFYDFGVSKCLPKYEQ